MAKTRKILCMTYRPGNQNPEVNQEPCSGDCYAYDDVLDTRGGGWTSTEIRTAMDHLLTIHAEICGNANYRLGIDLDDADTYKLFIGTFYRFGVLDMVTGASIQEVIEELAEVAASYFTSELYAAHKMFDPGLGHGACAHGDDDALKVWMAKVGGFDEAVLA